MFCVENVLHFDFVYRLLTMTGTTSKVVIEEMAIRDSFYAVIQHCRLGRNDGLQGLSLHTLGGVLISVVLWPVHTPLKAVLAVTRLYVAVFFLCQTKLLRGSEYFLLVILSSVPGRVLRPHCLLSDRIDSLTLSTDLN